MKRPKSSFPVQVGLVLCGVAAMAAYPLARWGTGPIIAASVAGALLSTCNVLLGYMMIEYGFGKSYTTFLKVVLGGMGLRMLLMLGMLLLLILGFRMHAVALTVSAVVLMMVYLILEVFYLQRKVDVQNQG